MYVCYVVGIRVLLNEFKQIHKLCHWHTLHELLVSHSDPLKYMYTHIYINNAVHKYNLIK